MLPVYFINLASRPDRRVFMEEQFRKLGLEATRVEAVTPADLSKEAIAAFCDPLKPSYLSTNMLSCNMSHERVWETMLAARDSEALIFEDDAKLSSLLPDFLAEVENIGEELIRIETTGARSRVYPAHYVTSTGVAVRRFRSTPMGAAGYILRRSAAEKIVGHASLRITPLDMALNGPFEGPGALLTRSLVDPGLCRQVGNGPQNQPGIGRSDIDTKRFPATTYADLHPVRSALRHFGQSARASLRNVVDHVGEQRNGLESKLIDFAQ